MPLMPCRKSGNVSGSHHAPPKEHAEKPQDPDAGHYNTVCILACSLGPVHTAFLRWPLDPVEAAQEGFIPPDDSPAVLKTEFPAELEHVTEHPPRSPFDGEILLENETPPGRESLSVDGIPEDGRGVEESSR